jgi:hypothetical protein
MSRKKRGSHRDLFAGQSFQRQRRPQCADRSLPMELIALANLSRFLTLAERLLPGSRPHPAGRLPASIIKPME